MHSIQERHLCMKDQVNHEPDTIYLLFYQYQAYPMYQTVSIASPSYTHTHSLSLSLQTIHTVKITLGRLPSLAIVSKRDTASSLPTMSFKYTGLYFSTLNIVNMSCFYQFIRAMDITKVKCNHLLQLLLKRWLPLQAESRFPWLMKTFPEITIVEKKKSVN